MSHYKYVPGLLSLNSGDFQMMITIYLCTKLAKDKACYGFFLGTSFASCIEFGANFKGKISTIILVQKFKLSGKVVPMKIS